MEPPGPGHATAKIARLVQDLRRQGVTSEPVLAAMRSVPRDRFVPSTFADRSWEDLALPIGHGQTVSQPSIVGLMTQALELDDRHTVFEIGTGSGYQTAILARLARRVFTIERHKDLWREADRRFAELRLRNVTSRYGDGTKGWPEPAPFDRILVTAAAREIPTALLDLLASDGILVAPVGQERRDQVLTRFRRSATGLIAEPMGAVRFVPLVSGLPRGGMLAAS
ncbi:MAG TPA: protein-L-isoaspartate(D-aspartate) O-methyltransferase [Stellaceae bacterium]|nr:protein-L-isoaspartate(D-aspartate) O-methyltransferase [Stellaceae bacterium]